MPPRQLEKHIASLASLGKCGKGFWLEGKLHKHMVRYFLAGRRHFSEVESVCISLDASRIGGKEVYVACIGGYNKAGQCKVMWAPPQEPAPIVASSTTFCSMSMSICAMHRVVLVGSDDSALPAHDTTPVARCTAKAPAREVCRL